MGLLSINITNDLHKLHVHRPSRPENNRTLWDFKSGQGRICFLCPSKKESRPKAKSVQPDEDSAKDKILIKLHRFVKVSSFTFHSG